MTLESYIERLASTTNWPADSWLCVCGTILHSLSSSCPCSNQHRKNVLPQQAIFILRKLFSSTTLPSSQKALSRPFSLPTLLALIYHPDNLVLVNDWLQSTDHSGEAVQLDQRHIKALTPPVSWTCHQLDASGCQCTTVRLIDGTSDLPSASDGTEPMEEPEVSDDELEIHATDNLMEFSSSDSDSDSDSDCAEATTASLSSYSPPTLRSSLALQEEKSQSCTSLTSRLDPVIDGSAIKPNLDVNSNTSVSIKDRLGPRLNKCPSTSKKVGDPDAVPSFFKGLYPPNLSPKNIRSTQVLPEELSGPDSSVRFIQELYCIELTQYYSVNCPPHLRGSPPYLVPEIFSLMRSDQLTARKCWLIKNFLRKNPLKPQVFVHADRALTNDELGTHRIPLQVVLSVSAPLIHPSMEYFQQISELVRLKHLGRSLSIKRKAEGQLSNPHAKKPTPLMDIKFPAHMKTQSFPPSHSAGSSLCPPPPTKTHQHTQRKALLPHPTRVEAITTTSDSINTTVEAITTTSVIPEEPTGSGFVPPKPQVARRTVVLDDEKNKAVDAYCEGNNPWKVITKLRDVTIRLSDIVRLRDNRPLNDRIMNLYMLLIEMRSSRTKRNILSLNTNFYPSLLQGLPLLKESKAIFQPHVHTVLIPIHLFRENHWTLIAINMKKRTISHLDSLPTGNRFLVVKNILKFVKDAYSSCFGVPLDPRKWDNKLPVTPTQSNNVDCGVFVLQHAENISRGAPHTFTQEEIPAIRRRMVLEITRQAILSA